MSDVRNVIIVGSGPAGLTAAIYAGRANLSPLIVAGSQPGGQLTLTSEVENYPGFAEAILGPELMDVMRRQAERFGTEFVDDDVVGVDLRAAPSRSRPRSGPGGRAPSSWPPAPRRGCSGLESERRLLGRGLSTCATCDGFFFKGQELRRRRRRRLRDGGGHLPHEVRQQGDDRPPAGHAPGVEDHAGPGAPEPEGRVGLEPRRRRDPRRPIGSPGVRLRDPTAARPRSCPPAACSWRSATRRTPSSSRGSSRWTRRATSSPSPGSTRTNVPGVFAAGDVADHVYRQAVTAAGTGCMAAIDAERFLEAQAH